MRLRRHGSNNLLVEVNFTCSIVRFFLHVRGRVRLQRPNSDFPLCRERERWRLLGDERGCSGMMTRKDTAAKF